MNLFLYQPTWQLNSEEITMKSDKQDHETLLMNVLG